ncbi:uncharacterized protein LOC143291994 [Babylonia areolata]|uniref:uncharacterized protein LOC143291994 n=1 Tax=Babylonia areolata TaxID=304850 RepID=UPI003FD61C53
MVIKSYIWTMDNPWAVLVTLAVAILFLSILLVVIVLVTYSRYRKYISQYRVYQTSYDNPGFIEPPSFLREYETQSLNMYVPPDEATPNFGEVGMRIHGDTVVDVSHSSHISGVVAAINPVFQSEQHTSHSEPQSSVHSTSIGESTTIL